jgi:hypothetical protein
MPTVRHAPTFEAKLAAMHRYTRQGVAAHQSVMIFLRIIIPSDIFVGAP